MNTAELVQYTRDLLNASEDLDPWTEAELLRYLNQSLKYLYARKIESDPASLAEYGTFSGLGMSFTAIDGGLWEGRVPDFVVAKLKVEKVNGGYATEVGVQDIQNYHVESAYGSPTIATNACWIEGGNRRILLNEEPDTTAWRLWYVRRPPDLVRLYAYGGTTTTITANVTAAHALGTQSKIEGYYVGAFVEITSAGSAPPEGERSRITGYTKGTYPTFTFTLDTTLSAATTSNDVVDMIPAIDELHHELLCYMAASRALDKEGNSAQKAAISDTAKDLYAQFLTSGETRQLQTVRRMEYSGAIQ